MPLANGGTFQPLQHRTGTLRERLHSYTKRTLGAGGSINEAVRNKMSRRIRRCILAFDFATPIFASEIFVEELLDNAFRSDVVLITMGLGNGTNSLTPF